MSKYVYNLSVNGKYAKDIKTWFSHQSNKAASLKLIIMQAISKYGVDTDVNELMYDNFFKDGQNSEQPIQSTAITPSGSQPSNLSQNSETTTEKEQSTSGTNQPNINLSFLSKK